MVSESPNDVCGGEKIFSKSFDVSMKVGPVNQNGEVGP